MVSGIIHWCLRNPFLMAIAGIALLAGGWYALWHTPVDAIPDIGEKQVIVMAEWPGRSPQDVDNQVTYPLTTSLTGTPGVKTIRSMSGFGFVMVYVIFRDNVDYYWARSRVLERMNVAQQRLPEGVVPVLGPDATALGQIYWYTVEGEGFDLAELRSIQDWYIRYQLNSTEGVSEVASVGGFVKQYQIDVHPDKLRAHRVTLPDVYMAVSKSNIDVGAKAIERNGIEFFIRGVGFIKSVEDLENVVIRQEGGTPIYVKNVATVTLGPDFRRGALDKRGVEAVGGVVLMRYGENPLRVMERVKAKLRQLEPGLPQKTLTNGRVSKVRIVPFYDRTDIIYETLGTLKETLTEESLLAFLIVLIFLFHLRATFATIVTLPLGLAICFILMYALGVDSNIMSLSGVAIAIGDVGDMGIIMTENIYRHVTSGDKSKSHFQKVFDGASEVGPAIITAVSNTIVSFVPVFFLESQEGRLFRPLAFTKTFAISGGIILTITAVPLMCYYLFQPIQWSKRTTRRVAAIVGVLAAVVTHAVLLRMTGLTHLQGWPTSIAAGVIIALAVVRISRERLVPLEENPIARGLFRIYEPVLRWILDHKKTFMALPIALLLLGLTIWLGVGKVFHPVEALINVFAYERASPELKRLMAVAEDRPLRRPLVELASLKWQTLRDSKGSQFHRFLRRRPDPAEREKDRHAGWEVVAERGILPGIGREFMPPLDEGSILYMPLLLPPAALSQAVMVNGRQDVAIGSVPEVESVVGKLGRAESALDPAPIGMMETIVVLKPESAWRRVPNQRWFSTWPGWIKTALGWIWPEERQITKNEILEEIQRKTAIPGVLPTFLQPIQTRIVMLQTGFRAMMGVKIYGSDLKEIERIGLEMEGILKEVPGAVDVIADRIVGKPYIEFNIDRMRCARYGVNIRDVQDVIEVAIGGMNVTESVEGRERYPIRIRYLRDFREEVPDMRKILVPGTSGAQIPLAQVADIKSVLGPEEIKGERGLLTGYVTMNTRERDEVSVVEDAEAALQRAARDGRLKLPAGYYWEWSGQFENQQRAMARMRILLPACLIIMFVMLYMGFRRWWAAPLIYFAILVSAAGGFIFLPLWGANLSVAVWVGFLVLFGVADDDGVVLSTYLEGIFDERKPDTIQKIRDAVVEAGLKRVRPSAMTLATTVIALMPVFWATGRGADVMQPITIPLVGGTVVMIVSRFIVPCLFSAIEEAKLKRRLARESLAKGSAP